MRTQKEKELDGQGIQTFDPASSAARLADPEPLLDMLETLCIGLAWNIEHYPQVMNESDAEALEQARALLADYGR